MNKALICQIKCPVLLVHGDKDEIVSYQNALDNLEAYQQAHPDKPIA